jgi:methylenetetrahydrofolate dehydrogenase (NADP+) / methenyltetrahydrofolate cyclohydrolase
MAAILMKGKPVADAIKAELTKRIHTDLGGMAPTLVVVVPAGESESDYYLRSLSKAAAECGINLLQKVLPADASTDDYKYVIGSVGLERHIHGILVMRPLPAVVDTDAVTAIIPAEKDVDGVTEGNMAALYLEKPHLVPATAASVLALLDYHNVPLKGARAAVVGRSRTVGKPTALMLLSRQATVTICHSRTVDLGSVLSQCDVVVVAAGVAGFIKPEVIKPGAVVIDAGFNLLPDGNVMGDSDPAVAEATSLYAPVPGGVGPLTVVCLLKNVVDAAMQQVKG